MVAVNARNSILSLGLNPGQDSQEGGQAEFNFIFSTQSDSAPPPLQASLHSTVRRLTSQEGGKPNSILSLVLNLIRRRPRFNHRHIQLVRNYQSGRGQAEFDFVLISNLIPRRPRSEISLLCVLRVSVHYAPFLFRWTSFRTKTQR